MSDVTDPRFGTMGFDVRAPWTAERASEWDEARRRRCLLVESVTWPLSVDATVWPTPARVDDLREHLYAYERLWRDLDTLVAELSGIVPDDVLDANPLMVQVWTNDGPPSIAADRRTFVDPITAVRGAAFELLGCDVADYWLLSGQMNCAFGADEKPALQAAFASHLNAHGLFDDPHVALQFRDVSNTCVPGHAPFFVYRLWRRRQ